MKINNQVLLLMCLFLAIPINNFGQTTNSSFVRTFQQEMNLFSHTIADYKTLYKRYQKCKSGTCTAQEEKEVDQDLRTVRNTVLIVGGSLILLLTVGGFTIKFLSKKRLHKRISQDENLKKLLEEQQKIKQELKEKSAKDDIEIKKREKEAALFQQYINEQKADLEKKHAENMQRIAQTSQPIPQDPSLSKEAIEKIHRQHQASSQERMKQSNVLRQKISQALNQCVNDTWKIDHNDPDWKEQASKLKRKCEDTIENAKKAFDEATKSLLPEEISKKEYAEKIKQSDEEYTKKQRALEKETKEKLRKINEETAKILQDTAASYQQTAEKERQHQEEQKELDAQYKELQNKITNAFEQYKNESASIATNDPQKLDKIKKAYKKYSDTKRTLEAEYLATIKFSPNP